MFLTMGAPQCPDTFGAKCDRVWPTGTHKYGGGQRKSPGPPGDVVVLHLCGPVVGKSVFIAGRPEASRRSCFRCRSTWTHRYSEFRFTRPLGHSSPVSSLSAARLGNASGI